MEFCLVEVMGKMLKSFCSWFVSSSLGWSIIGVVVFEKVIEDERVVVFRDKHKKKALTLIIIIDDRRVMVARNKHQ